MENKFKKGSLAISQIGILFIAIFAFTFLIGGVGFVNAEGDEKPLYYNKLWDYIRRYGQQINFSEPTEVFGVHLYGFKTFETTEIVNIQLRGFDNANKKPNTTVYHCQPINISNVLGWHFQDFSSSNLPIFYKDDYYILVNGENIGSSDPIYYFGCNIKSPTYPSLYECETNDVSNMNDYITYLKEPFMCKILQKINKTYFPKELEMQALIDNKYHEIINGTQAGIGNLSLTSLNFKPDNIYFDIPISINDSSLELIYNASYYIKMRKPLSVLVVEIGGGGGNDSNISTGIAPEIFYFTIAILIISIIAALTSYQAVKRTKEKKRRYRNKFYNKYMDILNLDNIIVSDKNSGLSVYEQVISDKKLNPTLVSGFLQAISSFGIELTGADEQFQTIKLEYQKSKILMSEFKKYRIISIFEENPSKEFTDALDPLSQDIDKYFGKLLENFDGDLTRLRGIKELLEKHLQISLIYPLKILIRNDIKLNSTEKSIINQAQNFMKKRNLDHFFVSNLMSDREFNPKRAEIILGLINKRVFQSII